MILTVILTIVGLFRTALIVLIIYFVLKMIKRVFLPLFVREMINKTQRHMEQQMRQQQDVYKNVGEVTIDHGSEKSGKKKMSRDEGEYIDYEEVK
ncbi:MAG: DUF4834 family protein [Bacteroidota bacterium]|nr:DUF4834 family protein [Bacteroidota bacterium]MDP4205612.1 DUF4834 family protein [Bacteroidota bacterium]